MSYTARNCYYFDKPGPENTKDAALFAIERAKELGLKKIVVASTSGDTAVEFWNHVKGSGIELIVVTHVMGFRVPGVWEFSGDIAEKLKAEGVRVVTGTHTLSGLERSLTGSPKIGGGSRTEAIAEALRRVVATGVKVAVECVLIAADQGILSPEEEVVACGGTISGSDTVCVIRPSYTAQFFDLQVREIVAMPRNR